MERAQGQAFQRLGVLAIVLGGHVLLVILLSSGRPSETRKGLARREPAATLVLLDLESRAEQPPLEHKPETPSTVSASSARADRARKAPKAEPSEPSGETNQSTAIHTNESGVIPKIDWYREKEIALETAAPRMIKEYERVCAQAERTRAPRPPGCNRRSFDGPWRPSGNTLQDIRDPDRPRSSVPDPLPEAFPKAPPSEVFRNEK